MFDHWQTLRLHEEAKYALNLIFSEGYWRKNIWPRYDITCSGYRREAVMKTKPLHQCRLGDET